VTVNYPDPSFFVNGGWSIWKEEIYPELVEDLPYLRGLFWNSWRQIMVKVADAPVPAADNDGWDTLNSGSIGTEWDFERETVLTGHFLGLRTVETTKIESGTATAIQIAPLDSPDDIFFVWLSADLKAFEMDNDGTALVRQGDLVRITYLGRKSFVGADGKPRQIKQYKVQSKS
jgi:hypothetical protein